MRLLFERPERMRREHEEVAALASQESWLVRAEWGFTKTMDVAVNVGIAVGDNVVDLVLVYPSLFPDIPAIVRPAKPTPLSTHQYGAGGALCLEYGPDNWTPDITGVMLLRSAQKLLASEDGPTAAPVDSRHELTSAQELRTSYLRFMLLDDSIAQLGARQPGVPLAIVGRVQFTGSHGVILVSGDTPEAPVPTLGTVDWTIERKGFAVLHPSAASIPEAPSLQDLRSVLEAEHAWALADVDDLQLLVTIPAAGARPRLFHVRTAGEERCYEYTLYEPAQAGERRLPTDLDGLSGKAVAIVGMGSVGSKVAASLTRAGIGRFVLVDEDVLAPHNLVRHDLDLREVGLHKAHGMRKALTCINPKVDVYASTLLLAGQESAEGTSTVLDKLGACDVIVDATANPDVLAVLSAVGQRRQRPVILGEVFGGGYGGLIARSRPSKEAPAFALRRSIQQYMDAQDPPPPTATRGYEAVQANTVFVATDADVSQLAASLTQMVLDQLMEGETQFPYSGYLLGFRPGWIFTQPFQVRPLELPGAETVPPVEEKAETLSDPRFPVSLLTELVKDIVADNQSGS